MRNFGLILFVGAILVTGLGTPAEVQAQFEEVVTLKEALKMSLQAEGAKSLTKKEHVLTDEQKAHLKKIFGFDAEEKYLMYTGLDAEKNPIGTAIIVNIAGKEGPLQMVVAVRPETGAVYNLGFTIFGEERGKPAATPAYLKQYLGADAKKPFVIGKDVDAVTGATWTSESVSDGVKVAVNVYNYLVLKEGAKESTDD